MEAHLIVLQKNGRAKKFKLLSGEFVVIGRSKEKCQVPIDDKLCSNRHCKFSLDGNVLSVEDLKSKNGVFLNGVRILKQKFYVKDKIKFGETVVYLNEKRMDLETIEVLTHQKTKLSSRETGNLTLELAINPSKGTKTNLESGIKVGEKGKKSKKRGRQKPIDDPNLPSAKPMSQFKLDMLSNIANLIDFILCFAFFIIGIVLVVNFVPELSDIKFDSNYIKLLTSEEVVPYTGATAFVSFVFYKINRNLSSGSIGERIFNL